MQIQFKQFFAAAPVLEINWLQPPDSRVPQCLMQHMQQQCSVDQRVVSPVNARMSSPALQVRAANYDDVSAPLTDTDQRCSARLDVAPAWKWYFRQPIDLSLVVLLQL